MLMVGREAMSQVWDGAWWCGLCCFIQGPFSAFIYVCQIFTARALCQGHVFNHVMARLGLPAGASLTNCLLLPSSWQTPPRWPWKQPSKTYVPVDLNAGRPVSGPPG